MNFDDRSGCWNQYIFLGAVFPTSYFQGVSLHLDAADVHLIYTHPDPELLEIVL